MGIWGPGIFDSDKALDVENVFEEALDDGMNLRQANQRVLDYFAQDLEDEYCDPLDGVIIILALAGLQMQYEDLHPEIRSKALAILEAGDRFPLQCQQETRCGVNFSWWRVSNLKGVRRQNGSMRSVNV